MSTVRFGVLAPTDACLAAARIAQCFSQDPALARVVVYRTLGGPLGRRHLRVAPWREQNIVGEVIGHYTRETTIALLIEDLEP